MKSSLAIAVTVCLTLIGISPASASDPNICSVTLVAGDNATAKTAEIQAHLDDATCDIVQLDGSLTFTPTSTFEVDGSLDPSPRDVTVRGAVSSAIVLSGATAGTIFDVIGPGDILRLENFEIEHATSGAVTSADDVYLKDMTFTLNETLMSGGAVYSGATVYLDGSIYLERNSATGSGGGIFGTGGIDGSSADVTLRLNSATGAGGGLSSPLGQISLGSLDTYGNSADNGGAIFATGLNVSGISDLEQDSAVNSGGSIFVTSSLSMGSISGSGSSAGLSGGTIGSVGSAVIGDVEISSSQATSQGGAIFVVGHLEMGSGLFGNVSAGGSGGAVSSAGGRVRVNGNFACNSCTSGNAGGAVAAALNIEVNGDVFITGTSSVDDGGAFASFGGAVAVSGDAEFRETGSGSDGGAVSSVGSQSFGSVQIQDVTAAGNGGALISFSSSVTITGDASFISSTSTGGWGGAVAAVTSVTIGGQATFSRNSAADNGGCIFTAAGAVTLSSATFDNCVSSGGYGGAVASASSIAATGDIICRSTQASQDGGCFFTASGNVDISGSATIYDSTSGGYGGAISSAGSVSIAVADFQRNSADSDGGAIFAIGGVTIQQSGNFKDNLASNGYGGAISTGGNASFADSIFDGNHSGSNGGAVFQSSGNFSSTGELTAINNVAIGYGGAISTGGSVSLQTGVFRANSSDRDGGAIFSQGGVTASDSVSFLQNSSASYGGAISSGSNVALSEASFIDNDATNDGGAVFISSGDFTLSGGGVIAENTSGNYGGAISIAGDVDITSAVIKGNEADSGGAIFSQAGNVTISQVTMVENIASSNAGGVLAARDFVSVNSYLAGNLVSDPVNGYAGAVYAGGSAEISFSTFVGNEAATASDLSVDDLSVFATIFADAEEGSLYIASDTLNDRGYNLIYGDNQTDLWWADWDETSQTNIGDLIGLKPPATIAISGVEVSLMRPSAEGLARNLVPRLRVEEVDQLAGISIALAIYMDDLLSDPVVATDLTGNLRSASMNDAGALNYEAPQIVTALPYLGPVIFGNPGLLVAKGEVVTLFGQRLSSISGMEIQGLALEIIKLDSDSVTFLVPKEAEAGDIHLEAISSFGKLGVQSAFRITDADGVASTSGPRVSIKRINENQVKVRIFAPIGAGKLQILRNGTEVAWLRATSENDPRLRRGLNGLYFVRTLDLRSGLKNVIEVHAEGDRLRRVVYRLPATIG